MMKVLVTGSAGFIGFHVVQKLLADGHQVIGLDNLNDYYSVELKLGRLKTAGITGTMGDGILESSSKSPAYQFVKMDLEDQKGLMALFESQGINKVVHLAAQAGVRYSLSNPHAYMTSNILGFLNILEACRHFPVNHLVYASSSSVYGMNSNLPFSVHDNVDHPVSLYAASKKSNELMAHTYSHLFKIPTTGLRFFTVYGPWGRPDMAPYLFTNAIHQDLPINVFNHGDMLRDFTYIDDIVEGVVRVLEKASEPDPLWDSTRPDPSSSTAPYRIYNIGNSEPVRLMDFIAAIENKLGKTSKKILLDMQPGDVPASHADTSELTRDFGYRPGTPLATGVAKFIDWYLDFEQKKGPDQ